MMQSQNNPPGANDATLVSPRAQQGAARLIVRRADGQLKEYGLEKDEISIGRLASNDVALPDDRSVSRRHAVIRRSNVGYVIEDQQSNNGTFVDGEKILYPFVLHNGQTIKVGANELTFTMSSAQLTPASQPEPAMAPASAAQDMQPAFPPLPRQPSGQIPTQDNYAAVSSQASAFPPPQFAPPAEPQPAFAFPPPAQPEPAFQPPAPAFPSPPQAAPAFQPPQPAPVFQQPAPPPAFPQFAPPASEPAPFQAPGFGGPQFPPQPQPTPGFPAAPAQGSGGSGMIVCQNCGQSTMANKAFCLNCGTSLAAPAPTGPGAFGAQPPGFYQTNPGAPAPGAPFGSPPPNNPQAWPPQPQPQPWQQQPPPPAQQPWQQPAPQFGGPAPAPAPGPIEAVVLYSRTMRLLQPGEIRVRLTTQFVGPGMPQPGTPITVRVWSAPPDAFFLSSQWVSLRVPVPGATEEGVIQATPGRPAAPGAPHQLFFLISDASGQPLQPNPAVAEIAITDQPVSPFDAQGVLRLPF